MIQLPASSHLRADRFDGYFIRRMRHQCRRLLGPLACLLVVSCAGTPPPPDWKLDAHGALETYAKLYLDGNAKLAEANFVRARVEIARTGRLDLAARAELYRCAIQAAALDFSPCNGFDALRPHATPEDLAYAKFLGGQWDDLNLEALPDGYGKLAAAKDTAARRKALEQFKDPVSRLIAAGVLLNKGDIDPAGLALATQTASDQGWRRPLLTWLGVLQQRALAAGDSQAADTLTQRIRLVESSLPESAKPLNK